MAADARRASDVVKRLRDFFGTGSTQLQAVTPALLLDGLVDGQRQQAEARQVAVRTDIATDLPTVLVDPVQIAVVLRNLVENALEAASAAGGSKTVAIRARRQGDWLAIEVEDSGSGVAGARLRNLWEPGESDKPGGMGIGLSICRAIVEAHGGRLWAETRNHGLFCLSLPIDVGANRAP